MNSAIGIAMITGALLVLVTTTTCVAAGRLTARRLDDTFEVAKALGAYGAILRMEAQALGVTVEELLERDARLARGES